LSGANVVVSVEESVAQVGGGGAPGIDLPSVAVVLPEWCASVLRLGDPSVLGRVERGRLLLDLRSVPPEDDGAVVAAVLQLEGRF
jgi:L-seryl-tRNA(Ser) seleniumtransferase